MLRFWVAFMACGYVLMFIVLAFIRIRYPFELEWIEGSFIDEARWILDGKFPYVSPTISFIPDIYTPLYYYISALFMKFMGVGFLAPRLVSVLASVGCFILLYDLVTKASGNRESGIIAAGLYAASYRFSGAWMDLAKTDSLFLFLLLLAFWVGIRFSNKPAMLALSGALFVLAVFTKQLALPIAIAVLLITMITSRGQSWLQILSFGILSIVASLGLEKFSGGWFSFYTIGLPLFHPRISNTLGFYTALFRNLWPSILLAVVFTGSVLWAAKQHRWKFTEASWQYLGFGIASILASWSIFLKVWTYANGYMPACLGIAMLAALGFDQILVFARSKGRFNKIARPVSSLSLLLLVTQFVLLFYNPLDQLPSREDRANAQRYISALRELPGDVWVVSHGFMSYQAGKPTYIHSSTLGNIGGSKPPNENELSRRRKGALEVIQQVIEEQKFQWIITDGHSDMWGAYYINVEELPYEFYPVTGIRTRPRYLLTRNPVAKGGDLPLTDPLFDVLFAEGWSLPESWGRWANTTRPRIQVALESGHDYQVEIQADPTCLENQPALQEISVGWNNEIAGNVSVQKCTTQIIEFLIPAASISKDTNQLWFEFKPSSTAKSLELSQGESNMIGIHSIKFTQH
jgi:hypothetical protein